MHGAVRRLAEHVKGEYELLSGGVELDLFFDSASLKWGDEWQARIRLALEETTFFIPIITPRYFDSDECRRELLSFWEKATELNLRSLILPLYFADVPAIEEGKWDDPAIKLVAERQREDWRNLRLLDETVQPYRVAVNRLAKRLLEVSREREDRGHRLAIAPCGGNEADGPPDAQPDLLAASGSPPLNVDDEIGVIELLAEGEDAFPRLVETLKSIAPEIQAVGELATAATEEIERSDTAEKGFRGRLLVMNRLAKNLEHPASSLETLTSRYAADLLILDPAMRKLIQLLAEGSDEDPEAVEGFFETVRTMVQNSGAAADSIQSMVDAMEGNENFSRELKVPIRRMRIALQSMIDGQKLIQTWQDAVDELSQPDDESDPI